MIYFEDEHVRIRPMQPGDPDSFTQAKRAQGWHATPDTMEMRLAHEAQGLCTTLVAEYDGERAGYIYVYWKQKTGPFAHTDMPEIVDFAVLEKFQRRGIGGKLMDAAEKCAASRCDRVYLGVGLHSGYGSAQRMYVQRGFIPDGSGVWYQDRVHEQYAPCVNDDDLVLYLLKRFSGNLAK